MNKITYSINGKVYDAEKIEPGTMFSLVESCNHIVYLMLDTNGDDYSRECVNIETGENTYVSSDEECYVYDAEIMLTRR